MALVPSTMLPLGTVAPDFVLPDATSGQLVRLDQVADGAQALLVMFICNHCPYVVHIRAAFRPLAVDYADAGLRVVAINANSLKTHPQDGPEHMKSLAAQQGWTFPYLFDESQEVARAYDAACTPDFFLFDTDLKLAYRGQLDGSRPGSDTPVTGDALRAAITAVLDGGTVPEPHRPSIGCNIKWDPEAAQPSA